MIEIFTRAKPGRPKNDDIAGYAGNTHWLMDGATQLVQPAHGHDAAWHVGALDRIFRQTLSANVAIPLTELARETIKSVAGEFTRATGLTENDPQELRPFSTLVLCRRHADNLEYLVVCDSTLLVWGPDHETAISDQRIEETKPLAQTDALLRQGYGFTSEFFKEGMKSLYLHVYGRINRPGGFDVVGQNPDVIERALTGSIPLARHDHILLMSDGFTRCIDTLDLYRSWTDVVEELKTIGCEAMLDKIRKAEQDDANGAKHPRSSIHDDATLLWVKPQI